MGPSDVTRTPSPPSPGAAKEAGRRVLEPVERTSEILFGLIMALTFTGSIRALEGRRDEIRDLLVAALGCNVAWGIVDGAMYLMGCLADRGAAWRAARAFADAAHPAAARDAIVRVLPPTLAAALDAGELDSLRLALGRAWVDPPRPGLRSEDWRGALGVFLLVTATTLPVSVPFLFSRDGERALRVSNAVAIAMMFAIGCAFGRAAGLRAWVAGVAMVVIGAALVAVTIALGG